MILGRIIEVWTISACFRKNFGVYVLLFVISIGGCDSEFVECDFEDDWCGWIQPPGSGDWKRLYGATDPVDTGPTQGHTFPDSNNYYLTFKHTDPAVSFQLVSPNLRGQGEGCFRFWYHMYGTQVVDLRLAVDRFSETQDLWTVSGNQQNKWHCELVDMNEIGMFKINITATKGNGVLNEIALDDFALFNTSTCKEEFCDASPYDYLIEPTTHSLESTWKSERTSASISPHMPTTTEPPDKLLSLLPYLVAIPVGLILVGLLAVCIYYKRLKTKKKKGLTIGRRFTMDENAYAKPEEKEIYDEIKDEDVYSDAQIAAKKDTGYIDILPGDESRDNMDNERVNSNTVPDDSNTYRGTNQRAGTTSNIRNPAFISSVYDRDGYLTSGNVNQPAGGYGRPQPHYSHSNQRPGYF